ncbi:MAG: peptidoglycan bridge formation glycyltransferase FemA/FemB family protein [bacterium]
MKVLKISKKKEWEAILSKLDTTSSFMQSWEWGEFKKLQGENPLRLVVVNEDDAKPELAAQLLQITVPFIKKKRLYCALGPVGKFQNDKALTTLLHHLNNYADKENLLTVDIELSTLQTDATAAEIIEELEQKQYKKQPKTTQPICTTVLDLTRTEEEILAAFKEKTRYNIRLAQRKGVVVKTLEQPNWEGFCSLLNETAERNQVSFYSKQYFENMGASLAPSGMLTMIEAWFEEKLIASLFVVGYQETGTYLFGASSNEYRNTMANFLLHWEAIRFAKRKGYTRYDFWGISDGTKNTCNWEGITRFKLGFNGDVINYSGQWRKVFKPITLSLYTFLQSFRTMLAKKRKSR